MTIKNLPPEILEYIIHTACQRAFLDEMAECHTSCVPSRAGRVDNTPRHLKQGALEAGLVCFRWHNIVMTSFRMWVMSINLLGIYPTLQREPHAARLHDSLECDV